ncbi:MAG: carbonic anhydrase [Pseudanabaena sp.]
MNTLNQNRCKNSNSTLFLFGITVVTIVTLLASLPAFANSTDLGNSWYWSYGGSGNPTQWGRIGKDFALCEFGKSQSPINIKNPVAGRPLDIDFDYKPSPLVVVNNGHTIQVNYEQGSSVHINGEKYFLLQFHFHTPSEHTINSRASALELHLVHRNDRGELAVVGVLLTEGDANPVIEQVWQNIPEIGKTNAVSDRLINAIDLLPRSKAYYSYVGSLTTPPCSEEVKWNLLVEPMTISQEQIAIFTKIYQVDARPIQLTNGRSIELHR